MNLGELKACTRAGIVTEFMKYRIRRSTQSQSQSHHHEIETKVCERTAIVRAVSVRLTPSRALAQAASEPENTDMCKARGVWRHRPMAVTFSPHHLCDLATRLEEAASSNLTDTSRAVPRAPLRFSSGS